MRSPCRFSGWCLLVAATGCESAALSGEPAPAPAPSVYNAERAPQRHTLDYRESAKPAAAEPAPSPTLAIAICDSPAQDPRAAAQTRFSIAHTRDLSIYSIWSAVDGEHFETRQFYAPSGELYYQKLIPFSSELDEPYPFTQPVSIPHATMIQPVTPNEQGELIVQDSLAVAGAWIGDHQLTGTWRLEVSLDGAKLPALSQSFEIQP